MTVRVRFAPSPTGYLHIGGARTALFNWMFARKHGGKFILRIEDTDQKRTVKGAVEVIMNGLRWMGLEWDEGPDIGGPFGPYIQTQRAMMYRQWANWLLENGHAYKCFCTEKELDEMRKTQKANKQPIGYDRRCRTLSPAQVAEKEGAGLTYVVRFKMALEGETSFYDAIRGRIRFPNKQVQDNVLLKSDGLPTYHLANVVDDHFMDITHIMRADEWISTAPLHVNLYAAFGWEMPVIAHMPVILNPSGRGKLSKRSQAFTEEGLRVLIKVEEFQQAGYLPAAVNNFLANVGWQSGTDEEKFTIESAIERFRLEDVNPAPSRMPYSKLDWLNGLYIQEMEPLALAKVLKPFLESAGYEVNAEALLAVAPALRPRLKRLTDAIPFLQFLFEDTPLSLSAAQLGHKNLPADAAANAFQDALAFTQTVQPFTSEALAEGLRQIGEKHTTNGKAGPFLGVMRLAMTGQEVSPPLFESMVALGRGRAVSRLETIITLLA
ncbi:MAG: glutamate--tRNA ligase [Chloroflexi bacterium]|nr:glutamate--tRNA ligase [Chloroflexota bacterium]MBP8054480.1 glutamate--tRNA ligase [Chloroflexota bacterium]